MSGRFYLSVESEGKKLLHVETSTLLRWVVFLFLFGYLLSAPILAKGQKGKTKQSLPELVVTYAAEGSSSVVVFRWSEPIEESSDSLEKKIFENEYVNSVTVKAKEIRVGMNTDGSYEKVWASVRDQVLSNLRRAYNTPKQIRLRIAGVPGGKLMDYD
ncbi:MAG TPA: hypothetical protein VEC17_01925 [Candidatus Binatia bacterium]|nr:hypothetical protein [Candidatus Binatia bacterium]